MKRFCSGCGKLSEKLNDTYMCPVCVARIKAINVLSKKGKYKGETKHVQSEESNKS